MDGAGEGVLFYLKPDFSRLADPQVTIPSFELNQNPLLTLGSTEVYTLFFLYKNVVFPAEAEYSYFCADFRLKIFLYYS